MAEARTRLKRFPVSQRLWHLGLIVVFMVLSVTGIAWMYIETPWGAAMAAVFGGFQGTLEVHRYVGLLLMAGFALHIVYLLVKIDWRGVSHSLVGPDSLVFNWRDVKGLVQHIGWTIGLARHPRFERWTWFEKFDYWAVWWGLMVLGLTGLILYNPVLTADFMPGWLINVALWIHRIEAVLAMAHVFAIHFVLENFRPNVFPYNAAMFDGTMPLDEAREEHAAWLERLEREGRLDAALAAEPPAALRILYFGSGYAIIALGLFLLVFGLINITAVTLF